MDAASTGEAAGTPDAAAPSGGGTRDALRRRFYDRPLRKDPLAGLTAMAVFSATYLMASDYAPELRTDGPSSPDTSAFALDLALAVGLPVLLIGLLATSVRERLRRRTAERRRAPAPAEEPTPVSRHRALVLAAALVVAPAAAAFMAAVAVLPSETAFGQQACQAAQASAGPGAVLRQSPTREAAVRSLTSAAVDARALTAKARASGNSILARLAADNEAAFAISFNAVQSGDVETITTLGAEADVHLDSMKAECGRLGFVPAPPAQ